MTIASTLSFLQDSAGAITTGTFNSIGPPITFSIAGSEKVRVDSNGYLLVNYSSSQGSYNLQVQGNAYFSGSITAGNINAGTVVGSISTASSLASGSAGNLVYQIGSGITGFVPTGAAGTVLIGSGDAPSFSTGLTLTNAILTGLTVSGSTTTGALTVAGGVGIGGNLYVGGAATATTITTFGTNIFRQPLGELFTIKSSGASTGISGSSSELQIQGNGANAISIASIGNSAPIVIGVNSVEKLRATTTGISIFVATSATSTSTGALQVVGGAGIGGKLYVGGMANNTSSYIVYYNTTTFELGFGIGYGGSGGGGGSNNIPSAGAAKTSSYTLATSDVGKFVEVQSGGSIIIPNSTFAAGDIVTVVNNSTGNITVTTSPTSTYIAGVNTTKASVTLYTRGMLTVFFINGTTCILTGNIA